MQILHEQINISGSNTIKVKQDNFPHFTFPWHYHQEFEIVYVLESFGKRYVGDSMEDFREGDLVLLGSNLPHFWKNAPAFYEGRTDLKVNAIIVQFPEHLPGIKAIDIPEFEHIQKLLKQAERGVQILDPDVNVIGEQIMMLLEKQGLERYMAFLEILNKMALSEHFRLLASPSFKRSEPTGTDSRLNRVLNYLNYNYTDTIKLVTVSKMAGMNTASFCRFFKEGTGKTIIEHLHDMRVGYARKLLMENSRTIAEIAFECGFNNISNFNRIFKKHTGFTPSDYRNHVKY